MTTKGIIYIVALWIIFIKHKFYFGLVFSQLSVLKIAENKLKYATNWNWTQEFSKNPHLLDIKQKDPNVTIRKSVREQRDARNKKGELGAIKLFAIGYWKTIAGILRLKSGT